MSAEHYAHDGFGASLDIDEPAAPSRDVATATTVEDVAEIDEEIDRRLA